MKVPWSMSTVGDQFEVALGKMLDAAKNTGEPKPYLGNRAVQWGRVDVSAAGVVPLTRSDLHRFRLRNGDLLVCEGGEVGRSAIWRDELPECYFQKALHRLRAKRGYDVRLMLSFLEYWASTGAFADYVTQTSIAHLPLEKFIRMPLPLPSGAEQQAIGDALEHAGEFISSLESMIAKQRDIKQGMMQEFLSGRSRITGSSVWRKSTIGEEFHVQLGKRLDSAVNRGELKLCVNNRGVRWGRIDVTQAVWAPLTKADISELRLKAGDVLVCEGGEIGRASVWRAELAEAYFLNTLHRLRSRRGYNPDVLAAFLERWATTGELLALVGKSSLAHLTKENLLRVPLPVPSPEEQRRIATALRSIDQLIFSLERLIAKQRDIKQGLMQELLTGRTRLHVEAVS